MATKSNSNGNCQALVFIIVELVHIDIGRASQKRRDEVAYSTLKSSMVPL